MCVLVTLCVRACVCMRACARVYVCVHAHDSIDASALSRARYGGGVARVHLSAICEPLHTSDSGLICKMEAPIWLVPIL